MVSNIYNVNQTTWMSHSFLLDSKSRNELIDIHQYWAYREFVFGYVNANEYWIFGYTTNRSSEHHHSIAALLLFQVCILSMSLYQSKYSSIQYWICIAFDSEHFPGAALCKISIIIPPQTQPSQSIHHIYYVDITMLREATGFPSISKFAEKKNCAMKKKPVPELIEYTHQFTFRLAAILNQQPIFPYTYLTQNQNRKKTNNILIHSNQRTSLYLCTHIVHIDMLLWSRTHCIWL